MKRYIFIIITIIAVLLVSCNFDAEDGIYSNVASSTESTSVNTKGYLGQYKGAYYYLTDDGIFKIGQEEALFADNPDDRDAPIIRSASLLDDGSLLILWQNKKPEDGAVVKYYAFDGTTYAAPVDEEGKFTNLLMNGLYYNNSGIYMHGKADSLVDGIKSVMYSMISEEYAFFCILDTSDNYKYYVIDASSGTVKAEISTDTKLTYIGFQAISPTEYVLLYYRPNTSKLEAYKMKDNVIATDPYTTLKSSVPYGYSTQAMSFTYNDEIYFKCTSYFEKNKPYEDTSEQISTGFAATLRTAEITNILPAKNADESIIDGVFIAGTKSSMLYKIDLINNTSERIK